MRGKRCGVAAAVVTYRIIPAHAGQTLPRGPRIRPWSDHPRACGANWVLGQHVNVAPGSSPRMRGKPGLRGNFCLSIRIIPAHAGQTFEQTGGEHNRPDHPRACGANTVARPCTSSADGSSPRMRGKLPRLLLPAFGCRIIPAHAGQTCRLRVFRRFGADHPRACGANHRHRGCAELRDGSSPRMRGKLTLTSSMVI